MVNTEKIILLELTEVISSKSKHISQGSRQIGFNNRIAYRSIINKLAKPIQYSQDRGAIKQR